MPDIERSPCVFTLPELWLLHDFVRHEIADMERWKMPPADLDLNEEIALAIDACVASGLKEYALDLTHHQLLVIDYNVRHDYKTGQMAKGSDVLLKTFRARRELAGLRISSSGDDFSYREASNASTKRANDNTSDKPNDNPPA